MKILNLLSVRYQFVTGGQLPRMQAGTDCINDLFLKN